MSTGQFNAQLFLRLAEFVVWAERHAEFAAQDAEFARLREKCAAALISVPNGHSSEAHSG